MKQEALAQKILVLGVDGMDPRFSKYMLDSGKMPNLQKIVARGSAREDLEMMGAQPTVTPPGWTTLATGAYSYTHGITGYDNEGVSLGYVGYSLNSKLCRAEQAWNCFAEAGKKTLVFHWPGSAWPPSLDSPYLHVIDGSQPGAVSTGVAMTEMEELLVASDKTDEIVYKRKAASDSSVPCVINDLEVGEDVFDIVEAKTQGSKIMSIGMNPEDTIYCVSSLPIDLVYSPLVPAEGWGFAVAEGAKEFVMLLSGGLLRRYCLLYKADGDWKVAIYKSKKTPEPVVVLDNDVFTTDIIDEGYQLLHPNDDKKYTVNRSMRILEVAEDGSSIRMYISSALDINNDLMWWPKRLHDTVVKKCGYPLATAFTGGCDRTLINKCLQASWEAVGNWQANALLTLIEEEQYDTVFSHFHNVDGQAHQLIKFLIERPESKIPPEEMLPLFENIYKLTDGYLGRFLHLLDEGWTLLVTSDHGQVCPAHKPPMICDSDVSLRVMQELGLTEVKHDAEGNELREIDWDKTYAINTRSNHVYLNLKGREPHGIIAPEDKYEWEEEVMTRLYGYRDKVTGKRVIALALRNKDAKLLGMGGPGAGDIIIWTAEGYNYDHNDGLSTTYGEQHTSLNCIFAAAGPGIKKNYTTDRVIRQVDFAPTVCVLGGVRMPAQCEGAPVYQILED